LPISAEATQLNRLKNRPNSGESQSVGTAWPKAIGAIDSRPDFRLILEPFSKGDSALFTGRLSAQKTQK
jgi:hypothetical protein